MTKQAVEELGQGLLILDSETSSFSDTALKQRCNQTAQKAKQGLTGQCGIKPDAAPDAPRQTGKADPRDIRLSLGTRLRQAREARGLGTVDVARELNLKECDVVALEDGDISGFAPVYAVGYVRTYAGFLGEQALGANVSEAVEQFRAEHFQPQNEVYAFPEQPSDRRLIRGSLVIGAVVMGLGLYMIWQFTQGAAAARGEYELMGHSAYEASIRDEAASR